MDPPAEVWSRQYIACEEGLGERLGRKLDLHVARGIGWCRGLTEAEGSQQNQLNDESGEPAHRGFVIAPAVAPVARRLRPTGAVTGRILDADGDTISGVNVLFHPLARSKTLARRPQTSESEDCARGVRVGGLCWSYGEVPDRPCDRSGAGFPLPDPVVRGSPALSRKRAGDRRQFRAGAAAHRRGAGEAADGTAVIPGRRPHAAYRHRRLECARKGSG